MLSQGLATHRNKAPTWGSPKSRPPPRPPHTGRGCRASHCTMPSAASPSTLQVKSMNAEHDPCQAGPASPDHRRCCLRCRPPAHAGLPPQRPSTHTHAAGSPPSPLRASARATSRIFMLRGVKRRAGPCPVKHLSRPGATTPLSPLPHWLHGGQGHCTAALAAAAQPWWSGGGDSLTSRPRPREGISKLSL